MNKKDKRKYLKAKLAKLDKKEKMARAKVELLQKKYYAIDSRAKEAWTKLIDSEMVIDDILNQWHEINDLLKRA
jgi:cell division protein FtsB